MIGEHLITENDTCIAKNYVMNNTWLLSSKFRFPCSLHTLFYFISTKIAHLTSPIQKIITPNR